MSKVETLFLITVNEDGTLTSYSELPEEMPEAARQATNFDVYQSAKQIVEDFDSNLVAQKVAQMVVQALAAQAAPQGPSVPSAVKDALKERGIDPESITPTE